MADYADLVLCMTVNPGWGGQPFIPSSPDKVTRLREVAGETAIEVDGGIDPAHRRLGRRRRAQPVRRGLGHLRRRRPRAAYRGDRRGRGRGVAVPLHRARQSGAR